MPQFSAEELPPIFQIYHVPTQSLLMSYGTADKPNTIYLVPPSYFSDPKSTLKEDSASWIARTESDPYFGDGNRVHIFNERNGLQLTADALRNPIVLAMPSVTTSTADGNDFNLTPKENTTTKVTASGGWLVSGDDLQHLAIRMNFMEEALWKADKTRAAVRATRPYLSMLGPLGRPPYKLYTPGFSSPNTDWRIMTKSAWNSNNAAATKAENVNKTLSVAGKFAADLLKLSADMSKASGKDNWMLPFLVGSMISRIVAGAGEIADLLDDSKTDVLGTIEKTLLPAVENIVQTALQKSDMSEMLGYVQTGANELKAAVNMLRAVDLDANALPTDAYQAVRTALGVGGLADLDSSLGKAHDNVALALGNLQRHDDLFGMWVAVAKQALAIEMLRMCAFPESHRQMSIAYLNVLHAVGRKFLDERYAERLSLIKNNSDSGLSAPNYLTVPHDFYVEHRKEVIDVSFGRPNALMAAIERTITGFGGKILPS